jgi:hypothetical protein
MPLLVINLTNKWNYMAEISLENIYPLAGLIVIGVTIWGMAKKFTVMDMAIQNDQKDNQSVDALNARDIKNLQEQINDLKRDVREIYKIILKLEQRVEDRFTSEHR